MPESLQLASPGRSTMLYRRQSWLRQSSSAVTHPNMDPLPIHMSGWQAMSWGWRMTMGMGSPSARCNPQFHLIAVVSLITLVCPGNQGGALSCEDPYCPEEDGDRGTGGHPDQQGRGVAAVIQPGASATPDCRCRVGVSVGLAEGGSSTSMGRSACYGVRGKSLPCLVEQPRAP